MNSKLKGAGKSLDQFRQAYDKSLIVPDKIRAALTELGDSWETEGEFVKRAGVSTTDFAKFRDGFAEFFVEVRQPGRGPQRVWAGTKAFAATMRGTIQ